MSRTQFSQLTKTSFELLFNFTIYEIGNNTISIISIFHDKLLVSKHLANQLLIYNQHGRYLSTINTADNDKIIDATWTPRGNIVYATSMKVIAISESGTLIKETVKIEGTSFSISYDDIIYLGGPAGVHKSTNDGLTWIYVLFPHHEWRCVQVSNVFSDHNDYYWIIENSRVRRTTNLSVYTLERRSISMDTDDPRIRQSVDLVKASGQHMSLLPSSKLTYDGNTKFFLADCARNTISVLSTNGRHLCQLILSDKVSCRLIYDWKSHILYEGRVGSVVAMYRLIWGKNCG